MELLFLWLIFAIITAVIASNKNRNVAGWFAIGLILGIFGIIIAAIIRPLEPSKTNK